MLSIVASTANELTKPPDLPQSKILSLNARVIIGVSRSKPHINHTYEKIICTYVCLYVCMNVCMYVTICRPRAHHTCAQIDTVKIVSVDHVLTLYVAHQTTET